MRFRRNTPLRLPYYTSEKEKKQALKLKSCNCLLLMIRMV